MKWAQVRLERQIVDTLLRRGFVGSAESLAQSRNLDGLVDVEIQLFDELRSVETALSRGSAVEALAWCKDNGSTLKKAKVRFRANRYMSDAV